MAKYAPSLSTFAEVEELYATTAPLNKNKLRPDMLRTQNIRPSNCRSRIWERIIKINKNKYALIDADSFLPYGSSWKEEPTTLQAFNARMCELAAIVWERKRGGVERMTVRNLLQISRYNSLPTSRMDFLYRHLPVRWFTFCHKGNQYLRNPMGDYVLPRNDFVPNSVKMTTNKWRQPESNRQSRIRKELVFERNADTGEWSAPLKEFGEYKWRIDTKKKKRIRPAMNKFYENYAAVGAMLEPRSLHSLRKDDSELTESINRIMNNVDNAKEEAVLEIMRNPDHEDSLALVWVLLAFSNRRFAYWSSNEVNPFQSRKEYNELINIMFKLRRKVEVKND